jgi:copper resistance protein C
MNRVVAAAVAIVAAVAASLLFAAPAWAHTKLVRTVPATDGTATEPFAAVTLTFNQPVRQSATTVTVTAADGASYSDGAARVVDADVIQAVRTVPAGPVRVTWQTVSADGHPIQGTFGFTVAPSAVPTTAPPTTAPATTAPATTAPATTAPPAEAARPSRRTSGEQATWLPWTAGLAAVALVAGGGLYLRRRRRES